MQLIQFGHNMNDICSEHSPCNKTVFLPVGAFNASWSKVKISPPALRMRALAPEVTRNAQTYGKY